MSSMFKSRAAGMLSVGMVTLALGAAGVAPTMASAENGYGAASISGLTKKQQKAKQKEIKKCKKQKKASKRKSCINKVNKKYNKIAKQNQPKPKLAATVDVRDDYFSLTSVTMKKGESIKWVWNNSNRNAHNVTLESGPVGLSAKDIYNLSTPNAPAVGYTFGPKVLEKTGDYHFVCTLHSTVMRMDVKVTN